jgi:hypothetical protein
MADDANTEAIRIVMAGLSAAMGVPGIHSRMLEYLVHSHDTLAQGFDLPSVVDRPLGVLPAMSGTIVDLERAFHHGGGESS